MLNIPNPLNVPSDVLLRELCEHVPAPIRDTLEAWHDAAETIESDCDEARQEGYDEARDEFQPYQEAWQTLFDTWEDACASGVWPAESPTDGTLAAAMESDIRRGADAVQAVRGALAEMKDAGSTKAELAATIAAVRDILAAVDLDA